MNPHFRREDWPIPLYKQHGMDDRFRQAVLILHPETLERMEVREYHGNDYDRMQSNRAAGHGFVEGILDEWLSPICRDMVMLRS